ncbi:MerR family transcriptional regulator [Ligilactobacillus sp.]|uniref:MerR family transcriptional regulator n=1 Tax=Ligilactobacillus sp. TaxID=2767921 RepID=UPI002FE204AF
MELTEINTGDFARLCHVTKKTLYFYDEIGLLKPVRVAENGYRFYDVMQCDRMATIKMLQELGASLDEIRSFFRKDVLAEQAEFMQEKRLDLDEKMKLLEERKYELDFLIRRMNEFMKIGSGTVFFETADAKRYGIVDQKLKKHFVVNSIEFGMQYGVIIDEEKLEPAAIFYRDDDGEFIKEAGEYVCMFQTLENGRMLENLAETAAIFQKCGGSGFIYHEDYANTIPEANGKHVIKLSQRRVQAD